jgi:chemotaxis protein CheX
MMAATYKLEGHLDSVSVPVVAQDLMNLRGAPLVIDGEGVASAGTLLLQVLVSAKRQWEEDRQSFQIAPISDALADTAKELGIAVTSFGADPEAEATT